MFEVTCNSLLTYTNLWPVGWTKFVHFCSEIALKFHHNAKMVLESVKPAEAQI